MMRKPLGRGLDALIGTAAAGIEIGADIDSGGSGAHFSMAPVASITAGPFQPRINFDKERLAELTRAIQSQGIIEPLIVRRIAGASAAGETDGPRYELIAGEASGGCVRRARRVWKRFRSWCGNSTIARRWRCRWSRISCARI